MILMSNVPLHALHFSSHPLMLQINDDDKNIKFYTIRIGNLSPDSVKALVAEALRMEDNELSVANLSATIHRKTGGNAFYVLVFLKSLFDEELLQHSFGGMKWMWNDDAVSDKLITENVTTILLNKLKSASIRLLRQLSK